MSKAQPKAFRKDGKIVIEIPEDNLVFAAENSPRFGAKITDREAYLDGVVDNLLEYASGTDDDPLFFRLLDEVTEDMVEFGADGIEPADDKDYGYARDREGIGAYCPIMDGATNIQGQTPEVEIRTDGTSLPNKQVDRTPQ